MRKNMARKDSKGYNLRTGECQRKDGKYSYAFTDRFGKRHFIYSKTLVELRERERALQRDYEDGLDPYKAKTIEVNHMVESYLSQKHDLKTSTKGSYRFMFKQYIHDNFGKSKVINVKYSDVKRFYYSLMMDKGISAATVDHVHTLLHPAFQMAIRDGLIRTNPTDGVMAEIKRSKFWIKGKRQALTVKQQQVFLDFFKDNREYEGWLPIITVLLGTGMRIGECLGLTWDDLDFENRIISVNHTISDRPDEKGVCRKRIQSTKSNAGTRTIPMIEEVYQAFLTEYEYQKILGFCEEEVDGYSGFVFSTAKHTVYLAEAVNNAIHRAIDEYNKREKIAAAKEDRDPFILPQLSAHVLRHTFCTRLCENESNLKVIQSIMGHADITTTMDIYAEATKEKKQEVMRNLDGKIII
ncbi:tyrosine-type recombinase/integrase [Oribacterium sp. P6A1]|uniref:tyrosine-type recombinase/integrase n=1 Tax=Oribacterium sp. P6A1 TaxID=1410612 RepID=UPI0005618D2D|nr:tyrosine-type recombinase/integrase [Oribacterium sp. P6A1]